MAQSDILFPTNISLGAVGGQSWSTRVVVTDGGYEYRQQLWGYTRGKWTVGHNLRTQAEFSALIAFHRLCLGKTYGFRFLDWTDYTDNGGGSVALNASGAVQFSKTYSFEDIVAFTTFSNVRLISKPVPGTVALFLNGTPYSGPSTIDYSTGVITGLSPASNPGVGDVYTWTGQFHVPCRFDTDDPMISMDLPTAAGWKGIPILEIRIPGQ